MEVLLFEEFLSNTDDLIEIILKEIYQIRIIFKQNNFTFDQIGPEKWWQWRRTS